MLSIGVTKESKVIKVSSVSEGRLKAEFLQAVPLAAILSDKLKYFC